jgi:mannose-6-phosphate isomerase-like protein (cupin superfamily)
LRHQEPDYQLSDLSYVPSVGSRKGAPTLWRQTERDIVLKIFDLNTTATVPMENGRGETIRMINSGLGTEKIDVHLNRLVPGGPRGRLHRHSQSDNIYLVRRGEGVLIAGGETHTIRADQVIYIPAGMPHSLSNLSNEVFEILEIYAPAGRQFDFTPLD